jgi:hypothetical protein
MYTGQLLAAALEENNYPVQQASRHHHPKPKLNMHRK